MIDQHEHLDGTAATWNALLDYTQAGEHLSSAEASLRFFQEMDYEQFEGFFTQVNGVIRNIPEDSRQVDGVGFIEVSLGWDGTAQREFEPPAVEDRRMLMQEAHAALKLIPDSDQAATMLGLVMNIDHLYNNGNGRMSRFEYMAMTHGYNGSLDDDALYCRVLESPSGRELVDLNPQNYGRLGLAGMFNEGKRQEVIAEHGYEGVVPSHSFGGYDAESVEYRDASNIIVNPALSEDGRLVLDAVAHDEKFETTVFMEFILRSGRDLSEYIKDGNGPHPLLLEKVFAELTDEDVAQIYSIQSALKKEYVRSVIGIFTEESNRVFAERLTEFYSPKTDVGR